MLHPHHRATFFLYVRPTLHCPIPPTKKSAPSHWGSHPLLKKVTGPPNPLPKTTYRHGCSIPRAILLAYQLCTINWMNLPYFSAFSDARTRCKQRHVQFPPETSQSSQNCAKKCAAVNAMVTHNVALLQRCSEA